MFRAIIPLLLTAKAQSEPQPDFKVTLTKEYVDGDWAMARDGSGNKLQNFVACMDGSMPAYYVKMSENNQEDLPRKWLIYFQGGAICHDEASCDAMVEAFPQLSSSNGWADTIELGGVFSESPDNAMADYNKVFYGYCSGDSHISSKNNLGTQGRFFDKYYMNGFGNTYALFDKLTKKYDLGAHVAGEELVIGGEGAGAIGAMFALELDDLPIMQLLQDQVGRYGHGALTDVKIMGLFDSPLELDQAPYQNSEYSAGLADRVQKLTELLQIGDQVDQDCLGGEGDAWKCVFGEFFLKYQTYPAVVLADQYDTRQLTAQLGYSYGSTFNWNTLTVDQKDYCDTYADETRAYLDDFTFPNVNRVNGFRGAVFSPSCGTHQSTMSDRYFSLRTGESGNLAVTYANTVVNDAISMVFGEQTFSNYDCSGASCSNGMLMVEDTCDGYQCSPYCNPAYGEDGITEPYVEPNPTSPLGVRATFGKVDIMNYIIIGAAAGGCLLISTLICLFVKCMRKGSDLIEPSPEISVEHHDTEMSNRGDAALHSASDFDANHNDEGHAERFPHADADKEKSPEHADDILTGQ